MNNLAILPYISMHALQIQNVKRNIIKKASVDELNKEIIRPVETSEQNNNDNQDDNELVKDSNLIVNNEKTDVKMDSNL
jgi:hypothetical protein